MFENGSLLRRRKRFKLQKGEKDNLKAELAVLANFNNIFLASQSNTRVPPLPAIESPVASESFALPSTPEKAKKSFTIDSLLNSEVQIDKPSEDAEAVSATVMHYRPELLAMAAAMWPHVGLHTPLYAPLQFGFPIHHNFHSLYLHPPLEPR